jgi:hypothetical protein
MPKRKYSDNDYKYIIDNYYLKTSTEISTIIGCSRQLVLKIWKDNGLKGKDLSRQYYCNFDYFKNIDTRNKAYLIGLLASDGNLFKREGHQGAIRLSLHKNDEDLLNEINKELNYTKPLGYERDYCDITINSDTMYDDLIKIGLYDNKSTTLDSKNIIVPKEFVTDYIRGYFDGDGSIFISKSKTNINIAPSCYHIVIAGYIHNLKSIQNILNYYNIKTQLSIDKRKYNGDNPFGDLKFNSSRDKYLFLKLIYKNIGKIIFMKRKYELSKEFLCLIESNSSNRVNNTKIVEEYNSLCK